MTNLHPEQFQDLNEFVRDIKIYHGSPSTHLQPGDIIKSPKPNVNSWDRGKVFGTDNPAWARMYANKNTRPSYTATETDGAIYEVEPVGALERFTDEQVNKAFKDMGVPYTAEYAADAWRVLGRYE